MIPAGLARQSAILGTGMDKWYGEYVVRPEARRRSQPLWPQYHYRDGDRHGFEKQGFFGSRGDTSVLPMNGQRIKVTHKRP
jgi:hypothetical protein